MMRPDIAEQLKYRGRLVVPVLELRSLGHAARVRREHARQEAWRQWIRHEVDDIFEQGEG